MSPDLTDVLIATIPSILPGVLVGVAILLNKHDISALRADVKSDIARMDGRINRVEDRIDRIEVKIDALSKQLSDAVLTLTGIGNDLDKRISRLEDRS